MYQAEYVVIKVDKDKKNTERIEREWKIPAKNKEEAINEYEKFKKRTRGWLCASGRNSYTRCDFKGLYKISKGKKTMIVKG